MNELVQIGPISPLRQRLLDDMALRRFGLETQRNYLRDVSRFATWLGRSPHTATAEDVRQFQFEQHEEGVTVPTMNSIVRALRFFFKVGRASGQERVCMYVSILGGAVSIKKKANHERMVESRSTKNTI